MYQSSSIIAASLDNATLPYRLDYDQISESSEIIEVNLFNFFPIYSTLRSYLTADHLYDALTEAGCKV